MQRYSDTFCETQSSILLYCIMSTSFTLLICVECIALMPFSRCWRKEVILVPTVHWVGSRLLYLYHTVVYPVPTLVHLVNWEQITKGEKDCFDQLLCPALNTQIGFKYLLVLSACACSVLNIRHSAYIRSYSYVTKSAGCLPWRALEQETALIFNLASPC